MRPGDGDPELAERLTTLINRSAGEFNPSWTAPGVSMKVKGGGDGYEAGGVIGPARLKHECVTNWASVTG